MTLLHPIAVVDQVIDEYRSYLRTEFRARDPQLRKALEDALDRSRFLAQEPFFQVYRPFKPAERWQDLGIDSKLAKVMEKRSGSATAYLHQSEAIAHLLEPEADPLAITTGTGSGKTECFLLPVIQNAIDDATDIKHPGLTALLVYPMGSLPRSSCTCAAACSTRCGPTEPYPGPCFATTPRTRAAAMTFAFTRNGNASSRGPRATRAPRMGTPSVAWMRVRCPMASA